MIRFEIEEIGRPNNDDKEAWKAHWKQQDQPWRTEPEIDADRQKYLAERRSIIPNVEQGIYPFRDIKLSRADVEWLLATHENGQGPVDWQDESQRNRQGLDMRGADLCHVDLSNLPLARIRSGLIWDEWPSNIEKYPNRVVVLMAEANLSGAHLTGAYLISANLTGVDFTDANLEKAQLGFAHLEDAQLLRANLKSFHLQEAHLERAKARCAHLERADLYMAHLEQADFSYANMQDALLIGASFEETDLTKAHLEDAHFNHAFLRGVLLNEAYLAGSHLNYVFMSDDIHVGPRMVDTHWGDVNLAVVKWSQMDMLGDEYQARQKKQDGEVKDKFTRLEEYDTAVRANRQLAVALHAQGLNEDAARFAYRGQLMQRKVFWYQRQFVHYLGSLFLDLLSGYGYRVGRCFIAYALVIGVFAAMYHVLGTHPAWNEAVVISMTAFHGRGFFPDQFHPGDPQALAAAIEAFVGLLIEITLIVTLTQRLFSK